MNYTKSEVDGKRTCNHERDSHLLWYKEGYGLEKKATLSYSDMPPAWSDE